MWKQKHIRRKGGADQKECLFKGDGVTVKSIIQEKDGTCYLCRKLYGDYSHKAVQEHHVIFGTANRKISEKYGLKVYLCLFHHTEGKEAVHRNAEMAVMLKIEAQREFKKKFPELDWISIFGKNYDFGTEKEIAGKRQQDSVEGFIFLPEGEGVGDDGLW